MSQAFVKEQEEQWLHEIPATLSALIVYLSRENNGVRVYERNQYVSSTTNRLVYEMSNGLSYSLDDQGKWFVV
jgi:hypothetical protein